MAVNQTIEIAQEVALTLDAVLRRFIDQKIAAGSIADDAASGVLIGLVAATAGPLTMLRSQQGPSFEDSVPQVLAARERLLTELRAILVEWNEELGP